MPGPVFGKYEISRRLAVGGMGEVFLARQVGMAGFERLVILKSLLPDVAEQPGAVDEFLDEARVAATLNHPNVVSIFEVGLWDEQYFIAMEFIDGDALSGLRRAAMAQGDRMPLPIVAHVVRDAALGLDHAHSAHDLQGRPMEIVHRDISPQNVMVRRDGVTKVVDFGIARAANRATRTRTGMTKGKIAYMPPEQVRAKPVDGRSDQYALGVVLWELCTNRRLFTGDTEVEIIRAVLKAELVPPSKYEPTVPPELDAICLRMLQRDANARYPTCGEAARALDGWLQSAAPGHGQADVAAFVSRVVDAARERSQQPTPAANFVIDLKGSSGSQQAPVFEPSVPHDARTALRATPPTPVAPGPGAVSSPSLSKAAVAPPVAAPTKPARSPLLPFGVAIGVGAFAVGGWLFTRPKAVEVTTNVAPPQVEPAVVVPPPVAVPQPARCTLSSVPPGASVLRGEELLGTTPLETTALPAGTPVALTFRLAGHVDATRTVTPKAGGEMAVEVALVPVAPEKVDPVAVVPSPGPKKGPTPGVKPAPAPVAAPVAVAAPAVAAVGLLSIDTTPWTQVEIDGEPYGTTPLVKKKLAVGPHKVVLLNEAAGIRREEKVVVSAEAPTKLLLTLP